MSSISEQQNHDAQEDRTILNAAEAVLAGKSPYPPTQDLLKSLLANEKEPHTQPSHEFAPFVGTWRLCFVTGTQKPLLQNDRLKGKGFYIPLWVTMQIVYSPGNPTEYGPQTTATIGKISNRVNWGGLSLSLTGPARCWGKKNIMAFDFTRVEFKVFGKTLYKGFVRGGEASEKSFWEEHVRTQAFFVYFLIHDQVLAARGRGGGIALWAKNES